MLHLKRKKVPQSQSTIPLSANNEKYPQICQHTAGMLKVVDICACDFVKNFPILSNTTLFFTNPCNDNSKALALHAPSCNSPSRGWNKNKEKALKKFV